MAGSWYVGIFRAKKLVAIVFSDLGGHTSEGSLIFGPDRVVGSPTEVALRRELYVLKAKFLLRSHGSYL